uniref:Uncharacterized protein n=1 Tax=Mycena chlorophos TaxID=658473 RepID=A0ABQ0L7B8_MYCCL|nr:predicted protein [Mycena chlorophos]
MAIKPRRFVFGPTPTTDAMLNDFLINVPAVLEQSDGLTMDHEAGVERHFFNEPGSLQQAVFYITGRIVGEQTTSQGDFIVLREPDARGLHASYRVATEWLQQHMAGSQPSENQNTIKWTYCTAPLGTGIGPTIRSMLQFNAAEGFRPGSKEDDHLAIGGHVRCAVRLFREDRACVECEDGNINWASHWVLDAEQVARCYTRAEGNRGIRRVLKRIVDSDEETSEVDEAHPRLAKRARLAGERYTRRMRVAGDEEVQETSDEGEENTREEGTREVEEEEEEDESHEAQEEEEEEEGTDEGDEEEDHESRWSSATQRAVSPEF